MHLKVSKGITMSYLLIQSVMAATLTIGFAFGAYADDIPLPEGDIILTISGKIANTNVGTTAQFDRAMLEGLGLSEIQTRTPWYDGEMVFSGVPMKDLLEFVGAEGDSITAVALNDYEVDIPVSDTIDTGVILASRLNGEEMTVRNKGPLFVIYPYGDMSELNNQTYYSRSAWQVTRLEIE